MNKPNIPNKFSFSKLLLNLSMIFLCLFFLVNVADLKTPSLSFMKLHPVTLEAFKSEENFKSYCYYFWIYNKAKVIIFSTLLVLFIIWKIYKKKTDSNSEHIELFQEFDLVFTEPYIQDPKTGKIIQPETTYFPKLDLSKVNEEFFFILNDVHDKLDKNLKSFYPGLLKRMKEKNMIPFDEGMIEPTGFPRQYKVTLFSEEYRKKQRLESVLHKARLYFEEKNGAKSIFRYPKIEIKENGNLILDLNGVNIVKSQITNALEILSAEFSDQNLEFINVTDVPNSPGFVEIHKEKPLQTVLYDQEKRIIWLFKEFVSQFDRSGELLDIFKSKIIPNFHCGEDDKLFKKFYSFSQTIDPIIRKEINLNPLNKDGEIFDRDIINEFNLYLETQKDEHTICDNFQLWEDLGPIKKMRDLWEKEHQFYWYFGELRDASIKLKSSQIILSGDNLVHPCLIGTTGSGKTEGLKSVLMAIKHAYGDNVDIFLANGTNSADLDPLAFNYSKIGKESAKPDGIDEKSKLVKLLNILMFAREEADRRGQLFSETYKETGKECPKISTYRSITGKKLNEIVIAIDEFAGYSLLIGYEQNFSIDGSVANILQIGLSQWRKYGIHFIVATQEAKADSIPRRLYTNMSGGIVFKISGNDKSYMESSLQYNFENKNPLRFKKGQGLFNGGDVQCELTSNNKIPITIPYIGSDIVQYIKKVDCSVEEHDKKEYDTDILSLTESDLDFNKLSPKLLSNVIDKCFLEREGWVTTQKFNPSFKIIHTYAENEVLGQKIFIAFADANDILYENFKERLGRENPTPVDLRIFFMIGSKDGDKFAKIKQVIEESDSEMGTSLILINTDYVMALREAYNLYKNKIPSSEKEVFNQLLSSVETRNKVKIENAIKDLYKNDFTVDDFYLKKLEKIREIGDAYKKGSSFEDFFLAMEQLNGFDTVKGKELSLKGIVSMKFANPQAEGGLDLFRFTNREKKIGVGFQLKNQMSKPLDTTVVDKMTKTKQLYEAEGITFEQFALVSTGKVTSQAKMEAEKLGFIVIDGDRLDKMIIGFKQNDKVDKVLKLKNPMANQDIDQVNDIISLDSKPDTRQSSMDDFLNRKNFLEGLIQKDKNKKDIEPPKKIDPIRQEVINNLIDTLPDDEIDLITEEQINKEVEILKADKEKKNEVKSDSTEIKTREDLENEVFQILMNKKEGWGRSDFYNGLRGNEKRRFTTLSSFIKEEDEFVDIIQCKVHFTRPFSTDIIDDFKEIEELLLQSNLKVRSKTFIYIGSLSKKIQDNKTISIISLKDFS